MLKRTSSKPQIMPARGIYGYIIYCEFPKDPERNNFRFLHQIWTLSFDDWSFKKTRWTKSTPALFGNSNRRNLIFCFAQKKEVITLTILIDAQSRFTAIDTERCKGINPWLGSLTTDRRHSDIYLIIPVSMAVVHA